MLTIILSILLPLNSLAIGEKSVKAGFIRDGNLFTFINNEEKQITNTGKTFAKPKWSRDGKWLLFQNEAPSEYQDNQIQVEVWAYNI